MNDVRRLRAVGAVLALALLSAACSGGSSADPPPPAEDDRAADCAAAVTSLLAITQGYLDSVAGTSASPAGDQPAPAQSAGGDPNPAVQQEQFTQALQDIRGYAGRRGCDPQGFQSDLAQGLSGLRAGTPVARAVLLQLQADSAPAPPRSAPLQPGSDVAAAVAAAPAGATVSLAAGTFVLGDTLALLRGVTLRGAGRDATVLSSTARDGVLLVLTGDVVTLQDLALQHTGTEPGSVVAAGPAATLVLTGSRVSGGRSDADGQGGVGILMASGGSGQSGPARRTSLQVTDSEVLDNAAAGVIVAGEHRAEIARSAVARNGQCGICYLGRSDGAVRESSLADNAAGLVAGGDAKPSISTTTVDRGEVGIQVLDRAAPEVTSSTFSGAKRAALLWTGMSTGRIDGNRCVDVEFGIVVGPDAAPLLQNNDCAVARGEQ